MTQMVTIEGSVTPSAELARGEQRTVVYTDRIERLVKRGYVVIVKGPTDADVQEMTPEPVAADDAVQVATDAPEVPQHPDEYAQHVDVEHNVPEPPPFPAGWQTDAPEAVVDNDPKAPTTTESGTGG